MDKLRRRVWETLEPAKEGDRLSAVWDVFILALIVCNVVASILSTVDAIARRWSWELTRFEIVSVGIFTVEYAARMWSCLADPRYAPRPVVGRLRFAMTPLALVDLIAILPFYLTFATIDLRVLRILRLVRIFRVAKLARYNRSLGVLVGVFRKKREELTLAFAAMLFVQVISASMMYIAEHDAQPDRFSDIPTAMWWSIMTLTTVGYGDVYPITPLGKLIAGVVSILGIAMFALPAGILGAGFAEEMQQRREKGRSHVCPRWGKPVE